MDTALSPGLIARFRGDVSRLNDSAQRLGVAVSGGPDSVALLLLANASFPGKIEAATVDHGLRPESADEAAFVADLCSRLAVPHATLAVGVPAGNLQHEARMARYRALGQWASERKIDALLTAHHADDQAETLLMRLNRGSGLSGLAGVRAAGVNPATGGAVLRPLLGWRRSELEAVVQGCGIEPIRDPSNEDDRFDRVRIRKALAQSGWLDPLEIAQSASWLGDADAALAYYAQLEWQANVRQKSAQLRYSSSENTPREIKLRVLALAIAELGRKPRLSQVADLLDALERGEGGNLAGVLVRPEGSDWLFAPEPPRG